MSLRGTKQSLLTGVSINDLVRRSVALGYDVMDVLRVACINPVEHYSLNVGLLSVGDPADFIVVDNLHNFTTMRTYCKGILAAQEGKPLLPRISVKPINYFVTKEKTVTDFYLPAKGSTVRVIEVCDGQLYTKELHLPAPIKNGAIQRGFGCGK